MGIEAWRKNEALDSFDVLKKEYEAYNFNGEAYEALLSEHKYSVNEKVWDRVDFGSVTLDN